MNIRIPGGTPTYKDPRHVEHMIIEYNDNDISNGMPHIAALHGVFYRLTGMCDMTSWTVQGIPVHENIWGLCRIHVTLAHDRKPNREEA